MRPSTQITGRLARERLTPGRSILVSACLVLLVVSWGLVAPSQAVASDWTVDDAGRRFRVGFDPASGIEIGVGASHRGAIEGLEVATELRAGIAYRGWLSTGEGDGLVSWQLDNRWLSGRVVPSDTAPTLDFDAVLYDGSYLRHDEIGYATLPGSGKRLPFPFDIGLELAAGRVRMAAQPASTGQPSETAQHVPNLLRIGVARAGVFLDPWRTGRPGQSLEIGVAVRYDIDVTLDGSDGVETHHRVAPLSAVGVRFRLEDEAGRTALDVRAAVVPEWTQLLQWTMRYEASLHLERVLIAINDAPIAATLDARWERFDTASGDTMDDVQVSAGLLMRFQIRESP